MINQRFNERGQSLYLDSVMALEREQSTGRLNEEFTSEFPVGYKNQYTPVKGRSERRPKRCDNNDKDEDNSPIINSVKNNI